MFGNRPSNASPTQGGKFSASGVDFPQPDRNSIVGLLEQNSVSIKYWKALACPCMNARTGQPNIACGQCRGLGKFHVEQEKGPEYLRAQVHSRGSKKNHSRMGSTIQGSASMTFFPGVIPGDGDLIQVCNDREVVNDEYHVVGAKLTDGSSAETFRYRDVACVELVAIYDPATKKAYRADPATYAFDPAARMLSWKNGLPEGSQYSVRYIAQPEYIVSGDTAQPLVRVSHDDGLPDPARTKLDILYPYNAQVVRLDRAILQRQRGAQDLDTQSTFNNAQGRGPFV